jgi:hypothetical protein
MKVKSLHGMGSVSHGGKQYDPDKNGILEVPPEVAEAIKPFGFVQYVPDEEPEDQETVTKRGGWPKGKPRK